MGNTDGKQTLQNGQFLHFWHLLPISGFFGTFANFGLSFGSFLTRQIGRIGFDKTQDRQNCKIIYTYSPLTRTETGPGTGPETRPEIEPETGPETRPETGPGTGPGPSST